MDQIENLTNTTTYLQKVEECSKQINDKCIVYMKYDTMKDLISDKYGTIIIQPDVHTTCDQLTNEVFCLDSGEDIVRLDDYRKHLFKLSGSIGKCRIFIGGYDFVCLHYVFSNDEDAQLVLKTILNEYIPPV